MNIIRVVMVLSCVMLGVVQATEMKDYKPSELPLLAGDFPLDVELQNERGEVLPGMIVDGITIIRVTPVQEIDSTFVLTVYLDNYAVKTKQNSTLPYELKWNFKGLSEGSHAMMLVFATEDSLKGVVSLNLTVEH